MIKIYEVEKTETKHGVIRDEPTKMLHDRNEANDMRYQYLQQAGGAEQSSAQSSRGGLYYCTVVLDEKNSIKVHVASEIKDAWGFAGLDVSKIHGEQVWIIKREPKNSKFGHVIEWTNDWAPLIREALRAKDHAHQCFQAGVNRTELKGWRAGVAGGGRSDL